MKPAFVRELKVYGGSWRKSNVALLIDLEPGSVENTVFAESNIPLISRLISFKNIKYLPIDEKPEILINKLNDFKPEFLGSDPNMLRELAFLKNNGYGTNLKPNIIISSGAMLDEYTKNYVEKAFDTRVVDVYGTTEAGPLAFECLNGNYHVHSDFVYLEFLDNEKKPVEYGKPGELVVTRLYGGGTPIIRYTGNEDILIPIEGDCDCGINTQVIKKIEGRSTDMISLPNGKLLSPLTVTGIPAKIMEKFGTYKIKQFQIVQHKIDEIEIKIVIDDKLKNIGLSVEEIIQELEKRFSEKIGNNVKIFVNEVDEIQRDEKSDNIKVVISKVKKS